MSLCVVQLTSSFASLFFPLALILFISLCARLLVIDKLTEIGFFCLFVCALCGGPLSPLFLPLLPIAPHLIHQYIYMLCVFTNHINMRQHTVCSSPRPQPTARHFVINSLSLILNGSLHFLCLISLCPLSVLSSRGSAQWTTLGKINKSTLAQTHGEAETNNTLTSLPFCTSYLFFPLHCSSSECAHKGLLDKPPPDLVSAH